MKINNVFIICYSIIPCLIKCFSFPRFTIIIITRMKIECRNIYLVCFEIKSIQYENYTIKNNAVSSAVIRFVYNFIIWNIFNEKG